MGYHCLCHSQRTRCQLHATNVQEELQDCQTALQASTKELLELQQAQAAAEQLLEEQQLAAVTMKEAEEVGSFMFTSTYVMSCILHPNMSCCRTGL